MKWLGEPVNLLSGQIYGQRFLCGNHWISIQASFLFASPLAPLLNRILTSNPYRKIELTAPAIRINNSYDIQLHLFQSPAGADKVTIYELVQGTISTSKGDKTLP